MRAASHAPPRRRTALAGFAALNAVAGWAGVIGLVTGDIDFGDTLDARLPFESRAVAGVALAVIVAAPLSVLAWWAWTNHPHTNDLSLAVGVGLIGWIVVQLLVLQTFSLFQAAYLAVGAWFVGASHRVHPSPAVRGALLIAVGAVTVATGVGLLPQLLEDFPSIGALLSIAALAGGVWIVARAVQAWSSGHCRARRFATGLGALTVVAVGTWLVAPAVAATNVPPSEITATPGDLGLTYQSITVTTDDGVALAGWYLPAESNAAVVVLHGAGSTRSDVLEQAAVVQRAGFGVLLIDSRGHGDSDGSAMDFGWFGDLDVEAATSYLASRPDIDPARIGLLGLSMGGEEAIGAAAGDPHVAAVVAEGATARTAADKDWLSDAYGWRGWLQEQIEKVQFGVTDLLTPASSPTPLNVAVARAERASFLLITAGTVADEGHAATHLREAAPDRVTVWTVADATHTGGLDTRPDEWESRVIGFLDTHLGTP
jgi:uncharacterized protein